LSREFPQPKNDFFAALMQARNLTAKVNSGGR
jgi:hypothetical protein